jgi:CheY-like chemotaxis protein/HPt (histidine-containing phosphotransfer) domain-containing protein
MLSLALGERQPSAERSAATFVTRHTIAETRRNRERILLVEDNITNQLVALKILGKFNYRAEVVANGLEAIEALQRISYDLVLMDCQMPEMDGFEATRRIRRGEAGDSHVATPVIAMTAHAMQGDREKCLEMGMNDYVSKPVDPAVLAKVLEKWLHEGSKETGQEETGNWKLETGEEEARNLKLETERESSGTNKPEAEIPVPVFDKAALSRRLMGDEELIREIISAFLQDIPRQIERLKGYLVTDDTASAERQAHTIRGAAGNVGGEALRAAAFEAEKAGRAKDAEKLKALVPELEERFGELRQAMETWECESTSSKEAKHENTDR